MVIRFVAIVLVCLNVVVVRIKIGMHEIATAGAAFRKISANLRPACRGPKLTQSGLRSPDLAVSEVSASTWLWFIKRKQTRSTLEVKKLQSAIRVGVVLLLHHNGFK